eukprot:15474324-Alexandrium_andersonii.AAC.1
MPWSKRVYLRRLLRSQARALEPPACAPVLRLFLGLLLVRELQLVLWFVLRIYLRRLLRSQACALEPLACAPVIRLFLGLLLG